MGHFFISKKFNPELSICISSRDNEKMYKFAYRVNYQIIVSYINDNYLVCDVSNWQLIQ